MSSRKTPRLTVQKIARLLRPVDLPPLCENPLVSILTPNYNYARFIGEAIESVQNQTYTNWEMIICDDGSTDDSCEVVEYYMRWDPRVRMVTKENGGQVSAANVAYSQSSGQIICFLDADDCYKPRKLEMVVQAFRSHPNSGFVGHRMSCVDTTGRQYAVAPSTSDPPDGWYGPSVIRYGALPRGLACSSAQCLRREISDRIFPVSEDFTCGPDGAIMSLAPLMTFITGIPTPLTEHRDHGNNSSGHIALASRRHGSGSVDPFSQLNLVYRESASAGWESAREYLRKVDPLLVESLPSLAECQGTLFNAYIQARLLQTRAGGISAYRDLLTADSFLTLPFVVRCFWRVSILLPRQLFRYALGPNFLREWFWRIVAARHGMFATQESERHVEPH